MGQPAARIGDPTAHGGVITLGFPMVLIGGVPAARVGDMHVCPMLNPGVPPPPHVGGPIAMGSPMVLIGGMPAARMGDIVVCAGPPDTIMMGCPTVLIGEGGSGSASGGGAGGGAAAGGDASDKSAEITSAIMESLEGMTGAALSNPLSTILSAVSSAAQSAATALVNNLESTTKEEHWIEFEFTDSAGNPVSGINYGLTHPDSKESLGNLNSEGSVRRDAESSGEGKVILQFVYNAKWSKDTAKVGEKIKLTAKVEGIPSGSIAAFNIFRRDLTGADKNIASLESKTKTDSVEVEWIFSTDNEKDKTSETGSGDGYSSPRYYFDVIVGNSQTRSGLLCIEDFLELELKDENDKGISNERYVLVLPSGEIKKGKLDGNGYAKIEKIPAGKCKVRFPDINKHDESVQN